MVAAGRGGSSMKPRDFHPADANTVVHASGARWPGIDLLLASDDIRRPTEWRIQSPRASVIVHLGGRMDHLETEVEARGGSHGPALPGECWMIPANRLYISRAQGGVIDYAVLSLDPSSDGDDASFDEPAETLDLPAVGAVRDVFLHQGCLKLIEAAREGGDLARMFGHSLGRTIRLHLRRVYGPEAKASPVRRDQAVYDEKVSRRLLAYIHERLAGPLDLKQLAGVTGQSTHRLLLSFRATFGKTPWQHILDERLRLAQRLLAGTRGDITSIALDAGFSSHSHLTRVFRQRLGCTPTQFRASQRMPWSPGWR